MHPHEDPELINSLQRIFASRGDIKTIVEYQQKLYSSLQELITNHRAVHEHVRNLTDSHNRLQNEMGSGSRHGLEDMLRGLDAAHRQTQTEVRQAMNAVNYIQQEVRKIPEIERRLRDLEREMERYKQDDRQDDRKVSEQEQRIRKLESR